MINVDQTRLKKSADYVRYLSLESIERANSGHPGLPLGCADLGILLFRYLLTFNPEEPRWMNRDRFILSAGHGSMLLYSLLHLAGYDITLDDMGDFRQLHSKTAGHPEYDIHDGIETTTGPLGQGFANAVGCAIEGKMLAERFNTDRFRLFDYTVYTLMGDGCNMEGISYEAASLAGHLGLDNLFAVFDSNNISIDGSCDITFTEKVGKRYKALGWSVKHADVEDINDVVEKFQSLKKKKGKPKLLIVKTVIGSGVDKKKGTAGIHGAPAGIDEIAYFVQNSHMRTLFEETYGKDKVENREALVKVLGQRIEEKAPLLEFPEGTEFMKEGVAENKKRYNDWEKIFNGYKESCPSKYEELTAYLEFKVPASLREKLLNYREEKIAATRGVSGNVLNICAGEIPQIVGGCADLAGSTKAGIKNSHYIQKGDFSGRNIAFGVREHAMGAVGNGLALNRSFIPFTSTFFTFFDYMKPPIRLAALMKLNHLFIFSHDSIYVGEDGPTHQPIEHLNAMRLIPDIYVLRPGNDMETAFAYLFFLEHMNGPAAIITTRQKLPEKIFHLPEPGTGNREQWYEQFKKGGYVFYESDGKGKTDVILTASGSELTLAVDTAKLIEEKKKCKVRVVSIPCLELLDEADDAYKEELFMPGTPLVLIEAASHRSLNLFYSKEVILVDIESFGHSAPGKKVGEHFGFTAGAVYEKIAVKI
jgi:transketolase